MFISGWRCLSNCVSPEKRTRKLCHSILYTKSLLMNSNNFTPQNQSQFPNTIVQHCGYKTSCTTSYHISTNPYEQKGDILYTLDLSIAFARFLTIFPPYLPSLQIQSPPKSKAFRLHFTILSFGDWIPRASKENTTNHAMKSVKSTDTPIIPWVNNGPTAIGLQKSCTVSKLETFDDFFFFRKENFTKIQRKMLGCSRKLGSKVRINGF